MLVEGTLSHSNHHQLIGYFADGLQFLLLQLPQIPIYPEVTHVFCIFFDFVDEVFIGDGDIRVAIVGVCLAAH